MRMLVTLEFADAGAKSGQHRVLIIGRNGSAVAHGDMGLSLDDAQTLLGAIQDEFVEAQAAEIVELARTCPRCGGRLGIKDWVLRRVHTLFGRVLLPSPRLLSCGCDGSGRRAVSPLKGWLARCSNELSYQAAKWGSAHSYRQAAAILHELLAVHRSFGYVAVRDAVLRAGVRLDSEPISLAFDGGYARRIRKGRPRNFEILTGAVQRRGNIRVFATAYAGRAVLPDQLRRFITRTNIPVNARVALMTDGAGSLMRLKQMLPIRTRFVLDYFHVAMKLRHIDQCIGRILPRRLSPGGSVFELYDRFAFLRAYLWTGRRDKLERSIDQLIGLLECVERGWPADERSARMAIFHVCDLSAYLRQNATGVVDYQSWKRRGWRISLQHCARYVVVGIQHSAGHAQEPDL